MEGEAEDTKCNGRREGWVCLSTLSIYLFCFNHPFQPVPGLLEPLPELLPVVISLQAGFRVHITICAKSG